MNVYENADEALRMLKKCNGQSAELTYRVQPDELWETPWKEDKFLDIDAALLLAIGSLCAAAVLLASAACLL